MKTKNPIFVLILLFTALQIKAQIVVDCNNRVALGYGNTPSSYAVDILGNTVIRLSGGNYITITAQSPYGWIFNPNAAYIGGFGYYNALNFVNAKYIYGTNIVYSSDERLKKNIHTLNSAIPVIKKLRPVSFDFNIDYTKVEDGDLRSKMETDDKNHLGFIAQEVQQVLPQSVLIKEPDSTLGIRMADFIPLLVKGMQEQSARIDSLISVIDQLKVFESLLKSTKVPNTNENPDTGAKLFQNSPNPFNESTHISYYLTEESQTATINIYDMNGKQLKSIQLHNKGNGDIIINGGEYKAGMYMYSLIADGKVIDTKRMVLTD